MNTDIPSPEIPDPDYSDSGEDDGDYDDPRLQRREQEPNATSTSSSAGAKMTMINASSIEHKRLLDELLRNQKLYDNDMIFARR